MMRARFLISSLTIFVCAMGSIAATAHAEEALFSRALVLGPLPAGPQTIASPRVHADGQTVREIDPAGWLPIPGDVVSLVPGRDEAWRVVEASDQGLSFDQAGVYWLAARLVTDRFAQVEFATSADAVVFVDGEEVDGSIPLAAGERFVFVRTALGDGGGTVAVTATAAGTVFWDLRPELSLADFDRDRRFASISDLAVAPAGKLIARRSSRRNAEGEGRRSRVDVLDADGRTVAADLGGPDASPVAFSPEGAHLLLRRPGENGADLLLWTAPAGPLRIVVADEPGLGLARFSPDGRHLLLASHSSLAPRDAEDAAARRWDALRERVSDWDPLPHLHLVDVATGARRQLTRAGDWQLDDAAWLPGGRSVLYGRTVPRPERPWFATEFRLLDLATGTDSLLTTFNAGWEVRPQAFAPHPDGTRVAFIGPPEQVGDGRPEHNVYNKQVWLLELRAGAFTRITNGLPFAFEGGRDLPAWEHDDRLIVPAGDGSRNGLVRLRVERAGWQAQLLDTAPETGGDWAASPDARALAYTASGPTSPEALYRQMTDGDAENLENPNTSSPGSWRLAEAEDASFTGPGGETIEAWWYRPSPLLEERALIPASVPLIVYYYGGSSPTTRGFNTTHQFWAAHGYAVLVVNPRGATGYGDAFADVHAGDWGPAASADIIAGTEALLARQPQLDPDRVGCYGGSYGGFMTMYLVTHSDLFAAAVAMYGISDLATYWGQGAWGWTYGDMANAGQTPWGEPDFFVRRSPLFAADRVTTPLLLLHGDVDGNVTPGESVQMFTALQTLGRDVEMVTFPGEDHGISGSFANRVAHRTMMLEWFDRWLRDRPEAWDHRWRTGDPDE